MGALRHDLSGVTFWYHSLVSLTGHQSGVTLKGIDTVSATLFTSIALILMKCLLNFFVALLHWVKIQKVFCQCYRLWWHTMPIGAPVRANENNFARRTSTVETLQHSVEQAGGTTGTPDPTMRWVPTTAHALRSCQVIYFCPTMIFWVQTEEKKAV